MIGNEVFTASIVVTLLTTLVAPLLLRLTLPGIARTPEDADDARSRHRGERQIEKLEALPHPGARANMPDDGDLANQFGEWVPDEGMRKRILVDNPARLYGF